MTEMADEVLAEIRAVREAHAAQFGFNLRAIFDDLKRSELARLAQGKVTAVSPSNILPSIENLPIRFAPRMAN